MTCIVGLVHVGRVYVGADSAGVDTSSLMLSQRSDVKVFQRGPYLMGFTSSFRMGQILQYSGELPSPPDDMPVEQLHGFMCTHFIDAVRALFNAGGYGKTGSDDGDVGGCFVVGIRGQLFVVHPDFQVEKPGYEFVAVGCGASIALGAMYTNAGLFPDPVERITQALTASEAMNAGVRRPFRVLAEEPVHQSDDFCIVTSEFIEPIQEDGV